MIFARVKAWSATLGKWIGMQLDPNQALYTNPGYFKPLATDEEKLSVTDVAGGFSGWPASGQVLLEFTVETADVRMRLGGTAGASSRIFRVGDTYARELDAANAVPSFIRVGATSGDVYANFFERA